ncbi:transmembrane protein 147 [Homalodisca vitripennis]|uniref:BOS complex subunit TMEM147 n=3 Tax=Proconiini TaxID=565685 RepID=A0A1B6GC67_9HEMI|nr:transmembrane protein 147 [Homalodisca vitripennis]
MTLYHFGNCLALVYVPYYLTYKHSGLSEYGAFWKCIQAGGIYIFTQLCKMMVLATFFPATDTGPHESVDFFGEFLKATVDLADLGGLYLVLAGIPGKGHAKVLTAGVGWAGAELVLSRCLLLWVGARGAEFDWKYIQKSLESNISLVQHITTVTLVWLWSRHDLTDYLKPFVTALLLLCSYKPLLMDLLVQVTATGPWVALLLRSVFTLCLGATTLQIYAGLAQTIGIY